jgi:hypothetical protein
MSEPQASDIPMTGEPHGAGDHVASHEDHGHAEEHLGPIDWPAWTAGVMGVLLGLAVAWCFFLSNRGLPVA